MSGCRESEELPNTPLSRLPEAIEYPTVCICAKVEHSFRIVKRQFGFLKTRYRGLKKNPAQFVAVFA